MLLIIIIIRVSIIFLMLSINVITTKISTVSTQQVSTERGTAYIEEHNMVIWINLLFY